MHLLSMLGVIQALTPLLLELVLIHLWGVVLISLLA